MLRIETPEGVDLRLVPAGPVPRAAAWLIDFLIRIIIAVGVWIPLEATGQFGIGLFLILIFVLEWIYPVAFEVGWGGSTPGKRSLGLVVLRRNGTPVDLAASVVRNLLRSADLIPVAYVLGVISMLVTDGFRRLGDLAADTVVVYAQSASGSRRRASYSGVDPAISVRPMAPRVALLLEEQRALISFSNRVSDFSPRRAEEVARVAAAALSREAADGGADPLKTVLAVAAWVSGRRPIPSSNPPDPQPEAKADPAPLS